MFEKPKVQTEADKETIRRIRDYLRNKNASKNEKEKDEKSKKEVKK